MSRPRSPVKTTKTARPAARGGAARGVYVQSPKSDIYVVMLSIGLGAMFLGSLLLIMILARYDFKVKASALPAAVSAIALV